MIIKSCAFSPHVRSRRGHRPLQFVMFFQRVVGTRGLQFAERLAQGEARWGQSGWNKIGVVGAMELTHRVERLGERQRE